MVNLWSAGDEEWRHASTKGEARDVLICGKYLKLASIKTAIIAIATAVMRNAIPRVVTHAAWFHVTSVATGSDSDIIQDFQMIRRANIQMASSSGLSFSIYLSISPSISISVSVSHPLV